MSDVQTYKYVAISPTGERRPGKMRAQSVAAVASVLEADGFVPGQITPIANPISKLLESFSQANQGGGPKVKTLAIATSTKQIEVLLRSGMPPAAAVEAAIDSCSDKKLEGVLTEIVERVKQGDSLSDAFAAFDRTFSESFISYVRAAEESGSLPETFDALYHQLSQQAHIEAEVKSATAYPKWAGGIAFLMAMGMVQFLLPQFEQIFAQFDAQLPAPTRLLIAFKEKSVYILVAIISVVVSWKVWRNLTRNDLDVGARLDRIKFRLPVFGQLQIRQATYRWSATMAGLNRAGVFIDKALEISARASGSMWIRQETPKAIEAIRDGESLAVATQEITILPKMVRSLLATGEDTGEMGETLDAAANAIAQETNALIGSLGKKIETLTLVLVMMVLGVVIGALWLPILTLSSTAADSF